MSCTVSQESRVMLAELLANEKEDTRRWLRAEMDGLVDPILDSLFQRLTNKLVNAGWEGTGGDCAQIVNPSDHVKPPNPQTSNSLDPTSSQLIIQQQHDPNVVHYSYQLSNDSMTIENEPMHCNEINNNQQCESQSLVQQQQQQASLMSPNVQVNFGLPLNELANEQSNNDGEDEEEGECFCDECLAAIKIDQEQVIEDDDDDDDDDSVQLIEDDQEGEESSSPPVKRQRMDPTQPNNAEVVRLSSRQPTDEAQQPNQVNRQFITILLQCPLSYCPATFPEDQLAQHLLDEHSMGPFRCLVKDCGQSFTKTYNLSHHLKQSHQSTTEWHCDKCPKHFAAYHTLSHHNIQYHQLGQYQCSFPACTFTGEYKLKLYSHYTVQHKQTFKCPHPGCQYESPKTSNIERHKRTHLGTKPYRCRLAQCAYAATTKEDTLKHIRKHLARSPSSAPNGTADPKDFLEIRNDLL